MKTLSPIALILVPLLSGACGEGSTPVSEVLPDFHLADLNPNSSTFGQEISPRDHLQKVSGWYFIHAT